MTAYPEKTSVVIVGAGPTGLTTANLLARYGVDFILLDREPAPLNLPRAIVLDDEGARTVQTFGLHEAYLTHTREGVGSRYYDDHGVCFAETGAGPRNYGFAKRQFMFQPEFETALRERLAAARPEALRYSSEVVRFTQTPDHVQVQVKDSGGDFHTICTNWLLACDGGRSPIRESLGIPMSGSTYEADWIVVDTVNDPDETLFSKFFCSSKRPYVSVPSPNGRRYEFMLLPGETREQVLAEPFLRSLLTPLRPYRASDILRKTVYTFHARMANRFRVGRVLLMGDAAHLTPPFAGQGMNAGLRDAHNVAWKIAAIERGGAHPEIVASYDVERRKPAWDMIQLAVAMGSIVMPMDQNQLVFRDLLLKALEPFPNVRDYLIQMRFKPKPAYRAGLFLDLERQPFDASLVGEMLPQPTLAFAEGPTRLDEVLGPGFALIAQDDAGAAWLSTLETKSFAGLPLAKLRLDPATAADAGEVRTMRPLRAHRDQVMLVRPDRYCAAAAFVEEARSLLPRYSSLLADPV